MSAGWTQQMAMTQRTFFVTPLLNKMQSWLALLKMLNQNVASQMSETHSPVNFPCECNLRARGSALEEPSLFCQVSTTLFAHQTSPPEMNCVSVSMFKNHLNLNQLHILCDSLDCPRNATANHPNNKISQHPLH